MSAIERDLDAACEVLHDAYEAAAAKEGWETQERSRKPWEDVPEANKATMRVAVSALLDHLAAARPAIEREAKAAAWDEGFSWGWSDAQEAHDVPQEMDRGDWLLCMPNPYRIEREGQA